MQRSWSGGPVMRFDADKSRAKREHSEHTLYARDDLAHAASVSEPHEPMRTAGAERPSKDWPLTRKHLRPGDVLCARGLPEHAISTWICRLDRGSYSHACLWDGERVIEASGDEGQIRTSGLERLIAEHEYTHVYRYFRDGLSLGDRGLDAEPVTKRANAYIGAKYAYGALGLIGVLVALGRSSGIPAMQEFFSSVGDRLTQALAETDAELRPMTCSQLVCLAFWEADPAGRRYSLDILYEPSNAARSVEASEGDAEPAPAELPPGWAELVRLEQRCRRRFLPETLGSLLDGPAHAHTGERALGFVAERGPGGGPRRPAVCTTPRDLERSPSLRCMGTLVCP